MSWVEKCLYLAVGVYELLSYRVVPHLYRITERKDMKPTSTETSVTKDGQ